MFIYLLTGGYILFVADTIKRLGFGPSASLHRSGTFFGNLWKFKRSLLWSAPLEFYSLCLFVKRYRGLHETVSVL